MTSLRLRLCSCLARVRALALRLCPPSLGLDLCLGLCLGLCLELGLGLCLGLCLGLGLGLGLLA